MIRDDKPMLPIAANGIELAQRYGHVKPLAEGGPKPWHVALVVWERFMRKRAATDLVRRMMGDQ